MPKAVLSQERIEYVQAACNNKRKAWLQVSCEKGSIKKCFELLIKNQVLGMTRSVRLDNFRSPLNWRSEEYQPSIA